MKKRLWLLVLLFALVLLAVVVAPFLSSFFGPLVSDEAPKAAQKISHSKLEVMRALGAVEVFDVEVARTHEQQKRGLMFRKSLASDAGMLFIFDPARPVFFWMKNTYVPLDMLFVSEGGRIVKIAPKAKPMDETPIASGEPVTAVLEINGGEADRRGIAVGDKVSVK